ncbi:CcdC family protein [Jeotgalibacillus campisalis]|uniref:Membrane protein n=1 Tax=Jeotgalibacillus campisalis TaxID=220754 RepID=A0A0C2VTS4_9BACL|nr:CcdC protein domain-containing protein [Jeotgalibacillus campisalis]KIL47826.1 membrane protein [Jeotgalibacillus campisalis]
MPVFWSTVAAVIMGSFVLMVRMKAAKRPVSAKKIILPPLFMSTGALMFLIPFFRLSAIEFFEALIVGMIFSIVLIKTSKFEVQEKGIYLKPSKAFPFILIGLLIVRVIMKILLSSTIDLGALSGMFWVLAFGMIVPWRAAMYFQYRKLTGAAAKEASQFA